MKTKDIKKKGKKGKIESTDSKDFSKLKKNVDDILKKIEPKEKRQSFDIIEKEEQMDVENEPMWKINIDEYNKEILLYKLLDMVNKKFSEKAVPIIEKMWELSNGGKTPVDFTLLSQNIEELTPDTIRKYLEMMCLDEPFIVAKNQSAVVTETNSFKLQVDAATAYLKGIMIESCLQSKFGTVGSSIYRVLRMKHTLTDIHIANLLICEVDDIKGTLLKMHQNGYIIGQEVPRSNIRGGKNSYYMWSVNFTQLNAILLNETIRALMNTMERYRTEISQKADLIAKFQEGEALGRILFDEDENQEYFDLDRRQNVLLDAHYYLSSLFFCLKDF